MREGEAGKTELPFSYNMAGLTKRFRCRGEGGFGVSLMHNLTAAVGQAREERRKKGLKLWARLKVGNNQQLRVLLFKAQKINTRRVYAMQRVERGGRSEEGGNCLS